MLSSKKTMRAKSRARATGPSSASIDGHGDSGVRRRAKYQGKNRTHRKSDPNPQRSGLGTRLRWAS